MPKLNQVQIALILIAIVVVGGVFVFGCSKKVVQQGINTQPKQTASVSEQLSVAGSVTEVTIAESSFTLMSADGAKEVTVTAGKDTTLVRLVLPFDLKNPPANKTFTPERKTITLKDLKAGDHVFVRSSQAIKAGQDVVNPIEIQILP